MALFAHDIFDTGNGAKPPLSTHPAFPAIVALWFATLLGLGCLILPGGSLERLVGATGIGALVPAANPPLGWTARGLVAVLASGAGALAGLAIARQVVRAHMASADWDDDAFTVTRQGPISVRDELGCDGVVNGRGLPVTNRRARAIAGDAGAEDVLYTAPLPGEVPVADTREAENGAERPMDFAEAQPPAPASGGDGERPFDRAAGDASGPVEELGMVELAQRLGTSLQKRREWLAQARALSEAAAGRIAPAGLDAAAPEDAARATAAYFGGARRTAPPRPAGGQSAAPARPEADAALRDALAAIRRVTGAA